MDVRSGTIDVNGTSLYYEDAGDGEPLVLLHGFSLDTRCWDYQFEVLAGRHRVIRYDMRGFGRSAVPHGGAYSHVGDLRQLLARLDIEGTALMGLSMGGGVAVDFALAHPGMVRALVLVDSTLGGCQWSEGELERLRAVARRAREGTIDSGRRLWMLDPMLALPTGGPRVAARLMEMVAGYSGWHWLNRDRAEQIEPPAAQRLGEIRVPTLVIVGERDLQELREVALRLGQGIPRARTEWLPGIGHLSNMEAPGEVNHLVMDFLGGVEPPESAE